MLVVGLVALVVLAIAIVVVILRERGSPDRAARIEAVRAAPGLDLAPPGAVELDRFEANPYAGGRASLTISYGTDLDADAIGSFYDEKLPPLGYEYRRGPEPANHDELVREYQRAGLHYRVTLGSLPRKVGTRWTTGPWSHVLYVSVGE